MCAFFLHYFVLAIRISLAQCVCVCFSSGNEAKNKCKSHKMPLIEYRRSVCCATAKNANVDWVHAQWFCYLFIYFLLISVLICVFLHSAKDSNNCTWGFWMCWMVENSICVNHSKVWHIFRCTWIAHLVTYFLDRKTRTIDERNHKIKMTKKM